jgi:Xaa-Pro aminopeptidase
MDYLSIRRQELAEMVDQEDLSALLVTNPTNVTYLTGFTGDSSHLILTRDRALLVSDFRYVEQIAEECPDLATHIRPIEKTVHQASAEVLAKLGVTSIGFESGHLSVADSETLREQVKTASWKGGRNRVEQLRAVKDAGEIEQIREAIDIADRAFTVFKALLRPDDREKDLADSLEYWVRRAGGTSTSFPSIVAIGERAALPHARPGNRRLGSSELLLVDWGASGRLYKCDLTRVLGVSTISTKLQELYEVVIKAQKAAISSTRPGAAAKNVDAEARAVIADAGFGDFFGHGLGHGFGLEIHEAPYLKASSEAVLQAGMVVTIEPGIYIPGWGGVRLEDDVLVTDEGCEVLSAQVPNELKNVFASG